MQKSGFLLLIALLVGVAVGYFILPPRIAEAPQDTKGQSPVSSPENDFCIQVITPAINPDTGAIQEFNTPCDVPDGWEVIRNEIPDLELESN